MDERSPLSSSHQLYARLGSALAPVVIDVRRPDAFAADDRLIISAFHRPHDQVAQWAQMLRPGHPVVVYCAHGREVSQGVASTLRRAGIEATYLEGGISAWKESGLPTRRKAAGIADDKWITRERPVIDRIACPWLISRFINPLAEFIFVPANEVLAVAKQAGATPYDVPGVEFTHVGEGCSFDTFVAKYGLERDPAIVTIAAIVRGADTDRHDLTPQSAGLLAISMGLRDLSPDDHEVLRHGFVIYDALYAWAKSRQSETHSWPPAGFPADTHVEKTKSGAS